jgi:DNA-3-methyladenine glycosylase
VKFNDHTYNKLNKRLTGEFFQRDVLEVAPDLLGKTICRRFANNEISSFVITEVEAYRGEEDLACHANKGKTQRTEVMYFDGGYVYVYLIYGMYYLLNFVTSVQNNPQAVLIRGVDSITGPGRVGKLLQIDKSFNKLNLCTSDEIWVEESNLPVKYITSNRVDIEYAGDYWKNRPWRYIKA